MITKRQLGNLKRYCEEYWNIENYEQAISDNQKWACHHKLEIDLHMTREQLKYLGLYYKVPSSELILLTEKEHDRLHHIGKKLSEETKQKIGKVHKGKRLSIKTKEKISEATSGENNPMYGKAHSKESKQTMSEIRKSGHWYNNGYQNKFCKECPSGFKPGRLKKH